MATSKLMMLIDMSTKMYDNKLTQMQGNWGKAVGKMQAKYSELIDKLPGGFGNAVNKMKIPLTTMALGAASMFGVLANKGVEAASKFDAAFLPIRNLNLDKTKGELDDYRSKIRDAAFATGANLVDSTNAVYDLQSATGMYGDDAIEIFKKVGNYSIATGANINDSMNSTTKAMKAFGLGVNDIDKLLESNAKTVQVGITTFDELAKVQTEYAGAASSAGQNVDVANKVFAMFTSVAKNSDVGANMTKTFFQGLEMQADKFKDVLKIQIFDKKGSMRQADDILKDISGKFKNMNDQQISEAINKIGGPEGLRGALAKVKTGAKDMLDTFNAFDTSKFSLKDALANAQGDVSKMKEIFGNRVEQTLSKFGEKFYPLIAGIFDKLSPVLEWLYRNFDQVASVSSILLGVLGTVTVAVWALNAAFLANPITWVVLAIGALVAGVILAIKYFNTWGASLLWLMGPIGRIIAALKLIYDHWDSIKTAFQDGGIFGGLKRIGQVLLDVVLQPLEQILGLLGKLPDALGGSAARDMQGMVRNFRGSNNLIIAPPPETQKNAAKSNSLYDLPGLSNGDSNANIDGKKGKKKIAKDVDKISGAAKEVKNITVKFDSIHRGDNIVNGGGGKGMSMEDFENFYNELMMRVIRNLETS